MPYRLLISMSVVNSPKYAPFLQPMEAVTGIPFKIMFRVKNIGESFPGGNIRRVDVAATMGIRDLRFWGSGNVVIPKLMAQEEFTFEGPDFVPMMSGVHKITIKVEVEGEEKIEYFQSEGMEPISSENYFGFISVIDRTLLDIVLLLQQQRGENNK